MRIPLAAVALIASTTYFAVLPAHAALDDTAAQNLAKKSSCAGCHKLDKHGMAPSYQDIAAKRKGQGDAVDQMAKAVRNGSKGTYGTKDMDPIPAEKISDGDLSEFLKWILTK